MRLEVGQKVLLTPYSTGANMKSPEWVTISKIGRKYFYVNERPRFSFDKENMRGGELNYNMGSYKIYDDESEYLKQVKCNRLNSEIRNYITTGYNRLNLGQAQAIATILVIDVNDSQ
jgi:hypothetical protein